LFLTAWLACTTFPFVWTFWGSFKVQADFFSRADWRDALYGTHTMAETGLRFTTQAYREVWTEGRFLDAAVDTWLVTLTVVFFSLVFGAVGGYALSRSGQWYAFWFLMAALVFRALPPIALVSGYMLPFFTLNIWGVLPTTIIVLVAINQPFTLWLLYSFFRTIPRELDESALVDGCTRFQAFRLVILPVMWPGLVTAGLFSLMLAYNDFTVTAMLLSEDNYTMVPKIQSYLGTHQTEGHVMWAVAAVVLAIAPLFVLVLFFQRQLISGLTAGAVKG
jgi:multiple sugar transport system permease protein